MRLTVMGQMAKGLALERVPVGPSSDDEKVERLEVTTLETQLESLKWHLWHGNVYPPCASQGIDISSAIV
jgi:hypothetical protein